jgi:hypothetical protein
MKYSIAGKQTLAFTKQERIMIDDIQGHMISLTVSEGINVNTAETAFLDGSSVQSFITSDLVNYSGPIKGYSKTSQKGDVIFSKVEGKIITKLSADGTPVTTIEGTFSWIKGTGHFENIKGGGTLKGHYITNLIYIVDWEGEYWIEK